MAHDGSIVTSLSSRQLAESSCIWYMVLHCLLRESLIRQSCLQDFLNGVCTHIIWLTKQKLTYYTGNFDTYTKTVRENEVIQQKKYEKEQDDIKHLKAFISSCGKPVIPVPDQLTAVFNNTLCHAPL